MTFSSSHAFPQDMQTHFLEEYFAFEHTYRLLKNLKPKGIMCPLRGNHNNILTCVCGFQEIVQGPLTQDELFLHCHEQDFKALSIDHFCMTRYCTDE